VAIKYFSAIVRYPSKSREVANLDEGGQASLVCGLEHDVRKLWPHFKKDVGQAGRVQRTTSMRVLLTSHIVGD